MCAQEIEEFLRHSDAGLPVRGKFIPVRPSAPAEDRALPTLPGGKFAGYSAASCRVPPSHAVTASSATAPGGSALMPTSVQVG